MPQRTAMPSIVIGLVVRRMAKVRVVREVANPTGEQHEAEQREGPLEPATRFEEPEAGKDRADDGPADGARERRDIDVDVERGSAASAAGIRLLRHGDLPWGCPSS